MKLFNINQIYYYDFSREFDLNIEIIPDYFYEEYPQESKQFTQRKKIIKINSNCVAFFENYNIFYTYLDDNIYYQSNKNI